MNVSAFTLYLERRRRRREVERLRERLLSPEHLDYISWKEFLGSKAGLNLEMYRIEAEIEKRLTEWAIGLSKD